jgi:hypothetical protein
MTAKKPRRITPVPTHLLLDESISIEARGLLAVLCAESKVDLSLEGLRKSCGVGRDKLAGMLAELAAFGVVRLEKGRGADGRLDGQGWWFIGGQQ